MGLFLFWFDLNFYFDYYLKTLISGVNNGMNCVPFYKCSCNWHSFSHSFLSFFNSCSCFLPMFHFSYKNILSISALKDKLLNLSTESYLKKISLICLSYVLEICFSVLEIFFLSCQLSIACIYHIWGGIT